MTKEQHLFQQKKVEGLLKEFRELDAPILGDAGEIEEISVIMSDGVALRTFVCKPRQAGPHPTLIMRSPYPNSKAQYQTYAAQLSRRGFAFVYQFCRGTGGSEGIWEPNVNERSDGMDTLNWLCAQDWVENVGYWGNSYMAFTGWILADVAPEKVKTMYLTHYGTARHVSAYSNGLFRQDVLTSWAMSNAGFPVEADFLESAAYRPQIAVDEEMWGGRLPWYRDWISNTSAIDVYWNTGFWKELEQIPSKVQIPIMIGEGWYDHHFGGAMAAYQALSEESKAHSRLRVGAWNHFLWPCVERIETEHLESSDVKAAYHWFDLILRQKKMPRGGIEVYEIGADRWIRESRYPFPKDKQQCLWLSPAKSDFLEKAREMNTESCAEGEVSFVYDPDHPVMSHGAESCFRTKSAIGSMLQPDCGFRDDVVSFVSPAFDHSLDILGKIRVLLQVSSDAEDTAFSAKVMEIYPDGKAYNIRSGITTLAYRNSSNPERETYCPGSRVQAEIELWDISWQLHCGSRLRVDISSSDFPQYAVHTNYPGVWSRQDKCKKATQTIYCGGSDGSRILLPLALEDSK